MSTIEDFRNAPVGATATHDNGGRAVKMDDSERGWIIRTGDYWSDELIERWGYTLEPPAPTTVRDALDLAWNLAHEVKPGQVIPADTRFLEVTDSGLEEHIAHFDFEIDPSHVPNIRTVEPLPDPDPDWNDAPAILASHPLCADTERIGIWLPSLYKDGMWELPVQQGEFRVHWSELENVTPLYPKGQEA